MRAEDLSPMGRAARVELSGVALHACRGRNMGISSPLAEEGYCACVQRTSPPWEELPLWS